MGKSQSTGLQIEVLSIIKLKNLSRIQRAPHPGSREDAIPMLSSKYYQG